MCPTVRRTFSDASMIGCSATRQPERRDPSGVLLLRDHQIGRVVILVGGLVALVVPIVHLNGRAYGDEFLKTDGALRFIWTLYMLGPIGAVVLIGAVREIAGTRSRVVKEE